MMDPDRPGWLPVSLREAGHTLESVGGLSYIVVDEIVDDVVTLAVRAVKLTDMVKLHPATAEALGRPEISVGGLLEIAARNAALAADAGTADPG
jgi:hypothetical protein